ncbi:multidrug effflux MFS transporter [Brevundimonas sp. 2R-24]|uniref:Bcr/CflA family efflux transporter n=1 Tax=Peiella sedimenti TaxID=3061083 RepID=A0ABT8SIN9_9CAUL|nr:multidrug effflux MFS transporter [Caulobacteraceae bacterium XZ-24]
MSEPAVAAKPSPHPGMAFPEFVSLIALVMALNALAIDAMLPALPDIGQALGVAVENDRQWVVTAYLLGFGVGQLVYGPLSDRYGRRPLLLWGLSIYTLFGLAAAVAPSFDLLLLGRFLCGLGAASGRVLAISIVRDCYEGRTMARVMSLTFLVFLGVPILAPSLGALILYVADWRVIFFLLAGAGALVLAWAALRLPETLHPEYRRPIRIPTILDGFRQALTQRQSVNYALASTAISGALFGFIGSSQQIFADVFQAPGAFPFVFAGIAGAIAVASLTNARVVERLGSRLVGHSALLGFILFSALHAGVALAGWETMTTFAVLQAATMFCFGLIVGNFGAMAMAPMGHIAGAASSAQGFVSSIGGALVGFFIGQQFDGTTAPLALGFTACGLAALAFVLLAERGRLFRAREARAA